MVRKCLITKADVEKSRSVDRGALAMRVYRECKSKGMMRKDGSPSSKAIQKLNVALDKYDREHMITPIRKRKTSRS